MISRAPHPPSRPRAGAGWRRFAGIRSLGLAGLLGLLLLQWLSPASMERARLWLFDVWQQQAPRVQAGYPVLIIDIDEKTLARLGQWPFSRRHFTALVQRAGEAGAAVLAFDMAFPEPDRLSPPRLSPHLPPEMQPMVEALGDSDLAFADAIGQGRVVLGRSALSRAVGSGGQQAGPLLPKAEIGGPAAQLLPHFAGLLRNLPIFEAQALGTGLFSILPERDGIVRRVPLAMVAEGVIQPALAVEALRVARGGDALVFRREGDALASLAVGGITVPTEADGRYFIAYNGHDPARYVSLVDVLDGQIPAERLRDKILLVGSSAIGLQDLRPTPIEAAMPGVEIHAQLIESLLSGRVISRPALAQGAEILASAALGLLAILIVPALGPLWVLLLGMMLATGIFYAGWLGFLEFGLLIDVLTPLLVAGTVALGLVFASYWRETRRREEIRIAFQRYLSPDMVERVARDPGILKLGGETREITVLFADLRGFTTISEAHRDDPEALTALLNRVLTPLSEAVISEKGTIDKYIGDAIMAFWNAPLDVADHVAHAARAALAMQARLSALDEALALFARERGARHHRLRLGIGLNSGLALVGNLGSDLRFDYSAIGDAVNLAARLEEETVTYGVPVLVGEAVATALQDRFAVLELDVLAVRGKAEQQRIFALLGGEETLRAPDFLIAKAAVPALLADIRTGNAASARARIATAPTALVNLGLGGWLAMMKGRADSLP